MLFSIIFIACSPSERDIQTTTLVEEKPKTGLINRSINHDSLEREYLLYVPKSYTGDEPVPLLFSFHGYTATAEQLIETADFLPTADRAGLILDIFAAHVCIYFVMYTIRTTLECKMFIIFSKKCKKDENSV